VHEKQIKIEYMGTQKFKIVCIVNKESLSTAFNDESITLDLFNNLYNLIPFLLITKGGITSKVALTDESTWDILLIHDKNEEQNKAKDLKFLNYFTKDTLVMSHEHANGFLQKAKLQEMVNNGEIKKYKIGMHIGGDHNGYALLKYLVKARDNKNFLSKQYDEAIEKLIKWFNLNEKLNAALDFLHQSLGGTHGDINILTKGDEKFDLDRETYEEFGNKYLRELIQELNSKTGGNYYEALRNVRDVLLMEEGIDSLKP